MSPPSDRRLLLHLGYGKTGTTTLQRAFFDELHRQGAIFYFGMFLTDPARRRARAFFNDLTAALYLEDDAFERALPALGDLLAAAAGEAPPGLPLVLSNEHFTLSSYSTRRRGITISPARSAARLGRLFRGLSVSLLVALRRQDRLMHSMFVENRARRDHANGEHFADLEDYVARCLDEASIFHPMYRFDVTLAQYEAAFPGAPVLLYLFEDFLEDQARILGAIADAIGVRSDVLKGFALPLPDLNAKPKSADGVELPARSLALSALAGLPGIKTLYRHAKDKAPLRGLRDAIRGMEARLRGKPERIVIPRLSCVQSRGVHERFLDANSALALRRPALRAPLMRHGYLAAEAARDAS